MDVGDFDPLKSNDREEEAVELLEAHVFPCIGSFTQHFILLGDQIQLHPSVVEYELATKLKLKISLLSSV